MYYLYTNYGYTNEKKLAEYHTLKEAEAAADIEAAATTPDEDDAIEVVSFAPDGEVVTEYVPPMPDDREPLYYGNPYPGDLIGG